MPQLAVVPIEVPTKIAKPLGERRQSLPDRARFNRHGILLSRERAKWCGDQDRVSHFNSPRSNSERSSRSRQTVASPGSPRSTEMIK
jgi:hypothetical protein